MQLKGKQIKDSSVEQTKLNITTDSITTTESVTNVNFISTDAVTRINNINYSTTNLGMVALTATIGDLACDSPVIETPLSNIMVKVNNVNVTVGSSADCYFSGDGGTTVRTGGQAQKGDYLYWNSSRFDLENDDEIDFIYIVSQEVVELEANSTVVLDDSNPILNIKYTGADDTDMTLTIDGVDFTVGNVGGNFVWDIGGLNETTLSSPSDFILQDVNGIVYTITFDGFGSLIFSVLGTDYSNDAKFNIGTGFDWITYWAMTDSNSKYMIGGNFDSYNGEYFSLFNSSLIRLNQDGSIDSNFAYADTEMEGTVNYIMEDSNNKYMIGGWLTASLGVYIYYDMMVRLEQDGTVDRSFNSGQTGFDNYVNYILEDVNNKYVVGGSFTKYNELNTSCIVRLEQDGSIDYAFNSGGTGFAIYESVNYIVEDNGKYLAGGYLTSYNGTNIGHIIRLNQDGSIDTSFNSGVGFVGSAYSIIMNTNNDYIITGNFTKYNDVDVHDIIRLKQDGSKDITFNSNSGFVNGAGYVVTNGSNGKYLIGGDFGSYNGDVANYTIRINPDGTNNTIGQ